MASALLQEKERIARGDLGYHYYNSFVLDPQLPPVGIARRGDTILSVAIECLIVGMEAEGWQLLSKADLWLSTAVERLGLGAGLYLVSDLTLCRWLVGQPAAPLDAARHVELLKEHLATHGAGADDEATWGFALPRLVDLGEAKFCVDWYETRWPRRRPSVATVRRFGQTGMAYLLARQRTAPAMSKDEMAAAQHDFLACFVPQGERITGCPVFGPRSSMCVPGG